ncbi:MAG: hypothetical protein ACLUMK_05190 [Christensenellales bacterium]
MPHSRLLAPNTGLVRQNFHQRQPNLTQHLGVIGVAHQQIEARLAAIGPK